LDHAIQASAKWRVCTHQRLSIQVPQLKATPGGKVTLDKMSGKSNSPRGSPCCTPVEDAIHCGCPHQPDHEEVANYEMNHAQTLLNKQQRDWW